MLADKAWDPANQPNADVRMFGFTVLFALLLLFVYVAMYLIGTPQASGRDEDSGRCVANPDDPAPGLRSPAEGRQRMRRRGCWTSIACVELQHTCT